MKSKHPLSASPRLSLTVQYALDTLKNLPQRYELRRWLAATITRDTEVTLRFVDQAEGRELNHRYRQKNTATNVLSFIYSTTPKISGDIVICVPVALIEAQQQNKSVRAHFAHLAVHGMLHLHGYDHDTSADDAHHMEAEERRILARFNFPDPYAGAF